MENATLRNARLRKLGRRRLRISSLALSALMTMHCRLSSSALTGEFFYFFAFLIVAVAALANPMRHFEVYLGQWSISGPGRAFRIIPMLDGIGIAMCINALVRAISCCTMAAIAGSYVFNSVSDNKLPSTYCRDFTLTTYTPELADIQVLRLGSRPVVRKNVAELKSVTVGLNQQLKARRNISHIRRAYLFPSKINVCKEKYAGTYPPMYTTPAYNYFYVEVIKFRDWEDNLGQFNISLAVTIIVAWLVLWIIMIVEKISYGRLIYNNVAQWVIVVPCLWCLVLLVQSASNLDLDEALHRAFRLSTSRETVAAMADALEVALYIHSLGVGTELIFGKALHNYASGHIDPNLSPENVWHSGIVLMLAGLHSAGAAMCSIVDYKHFSTSYNMKESALWIMPMYSKCTSLGSYSHLATTIIFSGLMFSYLNVAYFLLKTVLHIIFEYRVKLIFKEQFVVAGLILSSMGLNMIYATTGGIALLESVDAIMSGVATPFVLFMELVCLLYVYRSHDFQSDMHVATEDNTCAARIGIQWKIIPFLALTTLAMKISVLLDTEMDSKYMSLATIPLAAVVLALPLRAACNAISFLRHKGPTN